MYDLKCLHFRWNEISFKVIHSNSMYTWLEKISRLLHEYQQNITYSLLKYAYHKMNLEINELIRTYYVGMLSFLGVGSTCEPRSELFNHITFIIWYFLCMESCVIILLLGICVFKSSFKNILWTTNAERIYPAIFSKRITILLFFISSILYFFTIWTFRFCRKWHYFNLKVGFIHAYYHLSNFYKLIFYKCP